MKILVGSTNPVKINAVVEAFSHYYGEADGGVDARGMAAPSGVPDQPVGDETHEGARNRALWLAERNRTENLGAAFCVSIEGGVQHHHGRWFAYGVICIIDAQGRQSIGVSPQFELPQPITDRLNQGMELGHVMDELLDTQDTKRKGGAIGHFSRDVLSRQDITAHGVIMALIPFLNPELYFPAD